MSICISYASRPYYLSFSHGNPLLAAELAFGVFSLNILLRVIAARAEGNDPDGGWKIGCVGDTCIRAHV